MISSWRRAAYDRNKQLVVESALNRCCGICAAYCQEQVLEINDYPEFTTEYAKVLEANRKMVNWDAHKQSILDVPDRYRRTGRDRRLRDSGEPRPHND